MRLHKLKKCYSFKRSRQFFTLSLFVIILASCSDLSKLPSLFSINEQNLEQETARYSAAFSTGWNQYNSSNPSSSLTSASGNPLFADRLACTQSIPGIPTVQGLAQSAGPQNSLMSLNPIIEAYNSDPNSVASWTQGKDVTFSAPVCEGDQRGAVRGAGPQPQLGILCGPPYDIPCWLNAGAQGGAPGCCRRCFAPVCFGLYSNGVSCWGPNTPGLPWRGCNGVPLKPLVAWICPCRN